MGLHEQRPGPTLDEQSGALLLQRLPRGIELHLTGHDRDRSRDRRDRVGATARLVRAAALRDHDFVRMAPECGAMTTVLNVAPLSMV